MPLFLLTNPTKSSPGIGEQQLASLSCGLSIPSTITPDSECVTSCLLAFSICLINIFFESGTIPNIFDAIVLTLINPFPTSKYNSSREETRFFSKLSFANLSSSENLIFCELNSLSIIDLPEDI